MEEAIKFFVGLDVHKDTVAMAMAEPGREPARALGTVKHHVPGLLKALARLGPAHQVHVVYEAGPTGYGLQRALAAKGYVCEVIAPSMIPRCSGQRIKTDRRDCLLLAQHARAGQLRAVWVPQAADEAIRDLARAREDAVLARQKARVTLKAFLLRHDLRFAGRAGWSRAYYRWLASLSLAEAASQIALSEYLLAEQAADQRVQRLTEALGQSIQGWRFAPVVQAIQALRGIALVSAITLVAEIGDLRRFEHPRKLMGYLGLVPSERSSGERVSRGAITKTGNRHARRMLTEAAWNYRFRAHIGARLNARQAGLPAELREIGWKAQLRLTRRFAALLARGVQPNKICVAIARELSGFIWAIGHQALTLIDDTTAVPTR